MLFVLPHAEDRPDVATVYKNSKLSAAGYNASIDTSMLKGTYQLGLAGIYKSKLYICRQIAIPLAVVRQAQQAD